MRGGVVYNTSLSDRLQASWGWVEWTVEGVVVVVVVFFNQTIYL